MSLLYATSITFETTPAMKILFSDGTLWRDGGRLRLFKIDQGWRIVGPGYFCAVESREEGGTVMAELQVQGKKRGVAIEYGPLEIQGLQQ